MKPVDHLLLLSSAANTTIFLGGGASFHLLPVMYHTGPTTHLQAIFKALWCYATAVFIAWMLIFQGSTFLSSALKWVRPSSPTFPSNEMRLPLHFPKVAVSDQPLGSHARTTAESKWHFNSAHPFTSQHLLASPVLKRVPGKSDHAANFNELSAGSATSAGVPWTDAFQRTISFLGDSWQIYGSNFFSFFFFFYHHRGNKEDGEVRKYSKSRLL